MYSNILYISSIYYALYNTKYRYNMKFILFEDLDDWEVNHWLPSNRTSVPQLMETFSLFQLVGVNPVM